MVPQCENDLLTRAEASAFRPPCRHVRSRPYYPRGLLRDWAKAQIIEMRTGSQRLPPRSTMQTVIPIAAKRRAAARPIPEGPPVVSATVPRARAAWDIHSRLQEPFFS